MADKLGKATGPQRAPRKQAGEASAPPPRHEPETTDRRAAALRSDRYTAALLRMRDEADLVTERLASMPLGDGIGVSDELLGEMHDLERRLNGVRLQLDQSGAVA